MLGIAFTFAFAGVASPILAVQSMATGAQNRSPKSGSDSRAGQAVAVGVAAFERGDEQAAKSSFQFALNVEPANVKAHTYLGVLADRANDLKEAERHFAAAATAAPMEPSARNNYGAILLRLGRTAQAREQFEESLKLNRNQPSALVNLAQIRFAVGQPEDLRAARDLFERAQTIAPDENVTRALVITLLKLGDKIGAAASYQDYAAGLSNARAADAPAAAARADLGQALLEADLVNEAILELSAALAADSTNVTAVVALARAQLQTKISQRRGARLKAQWREA